MRQQEQVANLCRIKVCADKKVLKAELALWLLLLHDTHDMCLAEDGKGNVEVTELGHL
jgi:hypothetical protein